MKEKQNNFFLTNTVSSLLQPVSVPSWVVFPPGLLCITRLLLQNVLVTALGLRVFSGHASCAHSYKEEDDSEEVSDRFVQYHCTRQVSIPSLLLQEKS